MRTLITIFILLFATACSNPSGTNNHSKSSDTVKHQKADSITHIPDSITQFFISSCASDFHLHNPAVTRFRESYTGHSVTPKGEEHFYLRGQFQSITDNKPGAWVPFVTIKTSGYELWIGSQALAFCNDSTTVWDHGTDLSLALEAKLAYLKTKQ